MKNIKLASGLFGLALLVLTGGCGKDDRTSQGANNVNPSGSKVSGNGDAGPASTTVVQQAKGSVKGLWGGFPEMTINEGGVSFRVSVQIGIEANSMTSYVTCSYSDNSQLTSQVSTPIELTNDTIKVDQDVSRTVTSDGKDCAASIKADEVNYSYDAVKDQLSFIDPNQGQLVLTRISQ